MNMPYDPDSDDAWDASHDSWETDPTLHPDKREEPSALSDDLTVPVDGVSHEEPRPRDERAIGDDASPDTGESLADPWHPAAPPAPTRTWDQADWAVDEAAPYNADPTEHHPVRALFKWSFFGVAFLLLCLFLGSLYGINERRSDAKQEAVELFETGAALVDAGEYELAIANLNEAIRLQPEFAAAHQLLALAEHRLDERQLAPQAASPTPSDDEQAELLFADGATALNDRAWSQAITFFERLRNEYPSYRSDEVEEALFVALRSAADEAIDDDQAETALDYVERALELQPDNRSLAERKAQLELYFEGIEALEDEAWETAIERFRTLYFTDAEFLDVQEQLVDSYVGQGEALTDEEAWCDAADSYRVALRYTESVRVEQRFDDATELCTEFGATALSLTPTLTLRTTPTISTTLPITATATVRPQASALPAATPRRSPTPQLATTSVPVPTATPPPNPGVPFYYLDGPVTVLDNCGGNYILGTIRNAAGAPVPGVTVQAYDAFGNVYTAVSKQDPAGQYDIPTNNQSPRYDIQLFVNGQPASNGAFVTQVVGVGGCFQLNWRAE
ncbi:MAG: tetratricopeptide repeat protein [Ardenticatenales bacterium]|nr:tetratricopeptide repeat protein [Ardenticatenales bacterium]MCB9171565.1 tetratricopeptide repeat protein [Ardenticatenales bacterium]